MTSLSRTLDLPYRPQDLFDLVSDIGRYPDFVKWLRRLVILSEQESGAEWRGRAEATVGFLNFTESFITDIVARRPPESVFPPSAQPGEVDRAQGARDGGGEAIPLWSIDVSLVRGPFRKLRNAWRFQPSPTGTRVDFRIEFEFRNFVLQGLADANRDFAVSRLIESFTDEAARRYARTPASV